MKLARLRQTTKIKFSMNCTDEEKMLLIDIITSKWMTNVYVCKCALNQQLAPPYSPKVINFTQALNLPYMCMIYLGHSIIKVQCKHYILTKILFGTKTVSTHYISLSLSQAVIKMTYLYSTIACNSNQV